MAIFDGASALTLPAITGVGAYTICLRFRWLTSAELFPCITHASGTGLDLSYFPKHHSFSGDPALFSIVVGGTGNAAVQPLANPAHLAEHTLVIRWSGTSAVGFIDGVALAPVTVTAGTATIPTCYLGVEAGGTHFMTGWITHVARYTRAWTDPEVAAHAAGANPDTISSASLYDYYPLIGSFAPAVGSTVATAIGSPQLESSFSPGCRIKAGSLQAGPGGDSIRVELESTGGAATTVTGVVPGASIKVNGGSAIPLYQPLWDVTNNSVFWVLNDRQVISYLDDGAATKTGTGWASFAPFDYLGKVLLGLAGYKTPTHTDTAAYAFTGLVAGTYQLYCTYYPNADRTTQATYTLTAGGTGGPFTLDQTTQATRDTTWAGVGWHLLGQVTLSGTTATVTVSNAAGTGVLSIDGIMLRQVMGAVIPAGATVTFEATNLWCATAAGLAGATASPMAVALPDRNTYYGITSAPKTMKVGYNMYYPINFGPTNFAVPILYANLAMHGLEWQGPVTSIDDHWELTGCSGTCTRLLFGSVDNAVDSRGVRQWIAGTYNFSFKHANPTPPTVGFLDTDGRGIDIHTRAGVTTVAESGHYVTSFTQYLGYSTTESAYAVTSLALSVSTDGPLWGLKILDPNTPADWPHLISKTIYDRFHGKNFGSIRFVDLMNVNFGQVYDFSEFGDPDKIGFNLPDHPLTKPVRYLNRWTIAWQVASIAPVDTTVADADGIRALFPAGGTVVFKVTTTSAHDLRDASNVFITPEPDFYTDTIVLTNGGTQGFGDAGHRFHCMPHPTDPNVVFLVSVYQFGSGPDPYYTCVTTYTPSNVYIGRHAPGYQQVPLAHLIDFANSLGVPGWFNISPTVTDACADALGDYLAANLTPGTRCFGEVSNEVWNGSFWQLIQLWYRAYRQGLSNNFTQDDGYFYYAWRQAKIQARIKARYVAAGRDPAEYISVVGLQGATTQWTGYAMQVYTNTALFPSGVPPVDRWSIEAYCNDQPLSAPNYNLPWGDNDAAWAAFDRILPPAVWEVFNTVHRGSAFADKVAGHRAILEAPGRYTGGTHFNAYEGGPTSFINFGNDGAQAKTARVQAYMRDPDAAYGIQGFLRVIETAGYEEYNRYSDMIGSYDYVFQWNEFNTPFQLAGPGDGSSGHFDNRTNPYDPDLVESTQGYGMQLWAAAPASTYTLTAASGSFALTGTAAGLLAARRLTAASGSFTLTGQSAMLVYAPAGSYILAAAAGSYALTGTAAGLVAARRLAADPGSFALTGFAVADPPPGGSGTRDGISIRTRRRRARIREIGTLAGPGKKVTVTEKMMRRTVIQSDTTRPRPVQPPAPIDSGAGRLGGTPPPPPPPPSGEGRL